MRPLTVSEFNNILDHAFNNRVNISKDFFIRFSLNGNVYYIVSNYSKLTSVKVPFNASIDVTVGSMNYI